jgi:riboflavin synthase alpha subunit
LVKTIQAVKERKLEVQVVAHTCKPLKVRRLWLQKVVNMRATHNPGL